MVELVPAAVGGLGVCVSAVTAKGAIPVEIQAVGASVGEDAVQNHVNAQLTGLLAQGCKVFLCAQHGVWSFVVPGVVPVAGKGLGNGIQI